MRPDDVKALRQRLKLTQEQLARMVGVTPQSVYRWEKGHHAISGPAVTVLRSIEFAYAPNAREGKVEACAD